MPNTDYLRYNVGSIEELIRDQLREEFPDVDERSSSSRIVSQTVASVASLLIYQLNRNVANSNFTKTQSLNSIIEMVNQIGYNPKGWQSGSTFVDISVNNTLPVGEYIIPRYSFIETDAGRFSTSEDVYISYDGVETLVAEDILVYKGSWNQTTEYISDGSSNQIIKLIGSNSIDHNNIHVYVKESGVWGEYKRVDSLFTSQSSDKHFEARLGQNGSYTIEFGDDINGCIPELDSDIVIFYISLGQDTTLTGFDGVLAKYSSVILDQFLIDNNDFVKGDYLTRVKEFFTITNNSNVIQSSPPESVSEIKRNAPLAFKSQNRLVTKEDYEGFVVSNFSRFVSGVKVLNNDEYLDQYIKYYYDLGLENPELESRALYAQVKFANSCNANNVYLFLIPSSGNYLTESQKKLILGKMEDIKTLTSEIIPIDPIYINFSIATTGVNTISRSDIDDSYIQVTRNGISNRSSEDIRREVNDIILNYFSERSSTFDNTIDTREITSSILSIQGVGEVRTFNGDVSDSGVQFYQYNASYEDQIFVTPPTSQFNGIFVSKLVEEDLLGKIIVV